MKPLIAVVLMLCSIMDGQSQQQASYDSLAQKILKMDEAINGIHLNMVESHQSFKTGTIFILGGTALTIVGALLMSDRGGDMPNDNNKPTLVYLGAGITTVGMLIQIDSHKWIGRGARRKK